MLLKRKPTDQGMFALENIIKVTEERGITGGTCREEVGLESRLREREIQGR